MKCLKFWMNQWEIRQPGLLCLCRGSTVPIRLTYGCRSVKHIYNIYESTLWKSSFENVQIIGYELCLLQGVLETLMTIFCVHPIWKMTWWVYFRPPRQCYNFDIHAIDWVFFPLPMFANNTRVNKMISLSLVLQSIYILKCGRRKITQKSWIGFIITPG